MSYNDKIRLINYFANLSSISNSENKAPIVHIRDIYSKYSTQISALDKLPKLDTIEHMEISKQKTFLQILKRYVKTWDQNFGLKIDDASPFDTIYHEFGHLQDMMIRPPAKGCFDNEFDYPDDLVSWLDDSKKIEIANTISIYAATGPGEFIAEVYAKLMNGNNVNEDALNLYKKLEGPSIPGIIQTSQTP